MNYKITYKGVNPNGQIIFQGYGIEGPVNIIRVAKDTYRIFDPLKGHGVGKKLKISYL